jgi:HK97 family phage major capsid protein
MNKLFKHPVYLVLALVAIAFVFFGFGHETGLMTAIAGLVVIAPEDDAETKAAKQVIIDAHDHAVRVAEAKVRTDLDLITKSLEEQNTALKDQIKVIKDAQEAKALEFEEKFTELNRIKVAAEENKNKNRSFDVALNEAIQENEDQIKKFTRGEIKSVRMQLKAVGDMGLSSITDLSSANVEMRPGIINLPNRRIHMRNILNTGRMTTSDYHYLRETGGEGDVNTWTENSGAKSQLDLDYIEKIAPSQFIAGFLKISRKSLDDIPALRSSLAARLLEKYLVKEDQQILSGTGVGNQLDGILLNAEEYDGSKVRLVERIIDAIGQLEENEFYADGVIIKPRDWSEIVTTVSSQGEFTLPGLGVVTMQNGVLYINGVPIYKMNGMPSTDRQFLVGDWMLGAQLLIREDPVVEFFEQDDKNVQTNQITVRVEGRVALPIYFENAFVKGDTVGTPTT